LPKELLNKPESSDCSSDVAPVGTLTTPGQKSMQGPADAKDKTIDSLNWSHEDGTCFHTICQQAVQDEIEDVDQGVEVANGQEVSLLNDVGEPKKGVVDSIIEHQGQNTLVDYKTNDMSQWSIVDASRFGQEHGSQVQGYVQSPEIPKGAKGYIISIGKPSTSLEVTKAYEDALKQHGVDVVFAQGGTPEDVVSAVKTAMNKTRSSSEGSL
jgi:hypothetical protein